MRVRWKKLAEWEQAAMVAVSATSAASIALSVLAPDLGSPRQEFTVSKGPQHQLGTAERARIADFTTRALLALNTADLTRPGERRRIADSTATGALRHSLADGKGPRVHPRSRLTGARVSTLLLTSSGRGREGPNDTDRGDDNGWAHALAVVRGTTTGPDGAPVPTARRYNAKLTLSPQGWRFAYLLLSPDSTVMQLTARSGEPTEETLFVDEIEKTMRVVLGARPHPTAERPTRDERRRRLTAEGRRQYAAWLARIGIRADQIDGRVNDTAIIRRDRRSAELLMFVNVKDPEPPTASVVITNADGSYRTLGPPTRKRSGNALFPEGGACALKVTVLNDHDTWKIHQIADA
ncbi:hypothetical protein HUT06_01170 [Actinomadura sp. NAK00032]|uniref:hypothetical protein n=1 Tax=Actinomadura sp. NAK00032 TaxID=2742128 RepID=UPI0015922C8A|nr:hypothetical protein [Actinomadura sp. NAK00032]QKW32817.1 hypothetical protein HUT06_01170 [Actinomadura sp. NAK00032]